MTDHDLRPPRQQTRRSGGSHRWLWSLLIIVVLAIGGWYGKAYWDARQATSQVVPAGAVQPEVASPELETPASQTVVEPVIVEPQTQAASEPQHPLSATSSTEGAPVDVGLLDRWVVEWLGKSALKFVVTPGLAHHVVATIDNLPRSHAAPRLWPLSPVGGKMELEEGLQGLQIAPYNSARYDAVVDFVTDIEPAQAAKWYRQAYPLLQQSYENLGYPGKYFNDRLVEVIDHLLLTPEPLGPIRIDVVKVQGQIEPQQPWLRYEFANEDWQKLSAGQKILLRLGRDHRLRLKVYLQDLREQVATKPSQ